MLIKLKKHLKSKHGKGDLICLATIIILVLYTYWGVWDIFFQQDEWFGLGRAITRSEMGGLVGLFESLIESARNSRFLPLTAVFNYLFFNLFGKSSEYYGLLTLALTMVNAALVYAVASKVTQNKIVSLLSSIFWVTNTLSFQSITWISALIPSQFSLMFFLVSMYLFVNYTQKSKYVYLLGSIFSMTLSLWTKEIGIYYLIVFPLYFLLHGKFDKYRLAKTAVVLLIPALIAIIMPRIFGNSNPTAMSSDIGVSTHENIIYNTFLLPARSLYQINFPYQVTYQQITKAREVHYSQTDPGAIESLVADAFSLLFAFWILFILLIATLVVNEKYRRLIIFSLISFFASMLPFVVFQNEIAFIEQRYFVHSAIWAGMILSLSLYSVLIKIPRLGLILFLSISAFMIVRNINHIHMKLDEEVYVGTYRREILETVSKIAPNMSNNNIFYFFTDHTGFWEFQSGFGQTLGVWLYDTGKIPIEVLIDQDFWDSSFEGMKEYPQGKYGYFMTYGKLQEAFEKNNQINIEDLHAYYWDYQKHTVTNVSSEIREKLQTDLQL